MRKLKQLIK